MDIESIKNDLAENAIVDNPFDLLLYQCLDLCRCILFLQRRYRYTALPSAATGVDLSGCMRTVDEIVKELETLSKLSDDTIQLCQRTAGELFEESVDLNNELFKKQFELQTLMTRCVPHRDDEYERVRLGEDSCEYKRRMFLQTITNEDTILAKADHSLLCKLLDAAHGSHSDAGSVYEKLVKKYGLTTDDIEYIKSYKDAIKVKE